MQPLKSSNNFFTFLATTSSLLVLISISACSFLDSEKNIDTDKEEQTEVIDGIAATYWKGAKISIRSIELQPDSDNIDFQEIKTDQQSKLGLGKHLSRIFDWEALFNDEEADIEGLSISELVELAKEVYDMRKQIKTMNEDDYPTMMEVISSSRKALDKPPLELPSGWNSSMEHWLFAVVMEARLGFASWKTYELNLTHIEDFDSSDFKTFAGTHKGINQLRNGWYFLAEQIFSQNIAILDREINLIDETKATFSAMRFEENTAEQQFQYQMKAISYLLRGFSRKQTEKEELAQAALEDIQQSIDFFNKAGIDNELIWMAESYVYISMEAKDKAMASLTKLKNSECFSDKEKVLIQKSIDKVESRDPDSALNFISDKVIIYRLGLNYSLAYFNDVKWLKLLEDSDEGKAILDKMRALEEGYGNAKQYLYP